MDQAQSLRNLMANKKNTGLKVISVTGAKGGVGKSSLALNFAISLSRNGKNVLVVDMDLGLANIDVMLGIKTRYDLLSVIRDRRDIREVIEEGQYGVKFVSGGSGMVELLKMNMRQLNFVLSNLLKLNDIVDILIFDTGAGINDNIIRLICASHETLLITTPEPTAIMDAYALVKVVSRQEIKPNIRLLLNKAENEKEARAASAGFISIAKKYTDIKIDELGYILRDESMVKAVKMQVPLLVSFPKCQAALNIEQITGRYLMNPEKIRTGFAGFWEKLFGRQQFLAES